jgi:hypothetical protein
MLHRLTETHFDSFLIAGAIAISALVGALLFSTLSQLSWLASSAAKRPFSLFRRTATRSIKCCSRAPCELSAFHVLATGHGRLCLPARPAPC